MEEFNTNVTADVEPTYQAKIVKLDDGYHIVDQDGSIGDVLTITKDGISYVLTPNASNRKFYAVKAVEKAFETQDFVPLYHKATRTIGPIGTRSTVMPNAKLIAYLPEDLQEEYKAIIARAIEARDAAKAKPMTEKEKLEAKLAKAKAAYERLLAQAAGNDSEEVQA